MYHDSEYLDAVKRSLCLQHQQHLRCNVLNSELTLYDFIDFNAFSLQHVGVALNEIELHLSSTDFNHRVILLLHEFTADIGAEASQELYI